MSEGYRRGRDDGRNNEDRWMRDDRRQTLGRDAYGDEASRESRERRDDAPANHADDGYGAYYGSRSYARTAAAQPTENYRYDRSTYATAGYRNSGDRPAVRPGTADYPNRDGFAAGQNEPLERISDGEYDRGHFFGGGMQRGSGEHRGRGPKNYVRSDERIREDLNDRLSEDSWLDASEIDVDVSSGEVTLSGTVLAREDRRRAEDLAEQVSGVKHVQNNLRVQAARQAYGGATPSASGASTSTGRPPGSVQ